MSDFTYQDLLQIVDLIKSSSHFAEFHLRVGDIELDLKRGIAAPAPAAAAAGVVVEPAAPVQHRQHGPLGGGEIVVADEMPVAPQPGRTLRVPPVAYPEGAILIKSPMVGTFYRASEPGAKPFAEVGEAVEPETIVGIIEVMKLMNSIPAGHRGVITHILVGDGEPVEYGQVIIVIEPRPTA